MTADSSRFPQSEGVPTEVLGIIARCHWQTAKSVEHVAPHEYAVVGKCGISDDEFWLVANTIKKLGRTEIWVAPQGFYDSGARPRLRNTYLYVGQREEARAYWYTRPMGRVPMLNRELCSQQKVTRTRFLPGEPIDERQQAQMQMTLEEER